MNTRPRSLNQWSADHIRGEDNWKGRHLAATILPRLDEQGLVGLCDAAHTYLVTVGPIKHDYVLAPAFGQILCGIRSLLDGPAGRLDCGTVDGYLIYLAGLVGFNMDTEVMEASA